MPQRFNDTDSARHQPPTKAPSSFAKVASGRGKSVGGTANLRADAKVKTAERKGPVGTRSEGPPRGVQRFSDKAV